MHTATTVTLVAGGALLVIGGVAWVHSRSKSAVGTGKDAAAESAQNASNSAGKTGSQTTGAKVGKTQQALDNATAIFNFGLAAYGSAKAAAAAPGK